MYQSSTPYNYSYQPGSVPQNHPGFGYQSGAGAPGQPPNPGIYGYSDKKSKFNDSPYLYSNPQDVPPPPGFDQPSQPLPEHQSQDSGPKRKWNDVFAILIPVASIALFAVFYKLLTNRSASVFWKYTGYFSSGNGPLLSGFPAYRLLVLFPLAVAATNLLSVSFVNYFVSEVLVKVTIALIMFIAYAISVSSTFIATRARTLNGNFAGPLMFSALVTIVYAIISYFVYKFFSKRAAVIAEMVKSSYVGFRLRKKSIIPVILSQVIVTIILLFSLYSFKRLLFNSPITLAIPNINGNIGLYSKREELMQAAPKDISPDSYASFLRTYYVQAYDPQSSNPVADSLGLFIIQLLFGFYLVYFIITLSSSIVLGYTATWVLLGDRLPSGKRMIKQSNPVKNATINSMTTSLGSISLFSLVIFMLELVVFLISFLTSAARDSEDTGFIGKLFLGLIRRIAEILKDIAASINTYSLVHNAIYGDNFTKCFKNAWQRIKLHYYGLFSIFVSYRAYLYATTILTSIVPNIVVLYLVFMSISSDKRYSLTGYLFPCESISALGEIRDSSKLTFPLPSRSFDGVACNTSVFLDILFIPVIVLYTMSTIFYKYVMSTSNAIIGCYIESPSSVKVSSDKLYNELQIVFPLPDTNI